MFKSVCMFAPFTAWKYQCKLKSAVEKLLTEKLEVIWSPNVSNFCMKVLQFFISMEPHALINSHVPNFLTLTDNLNKMHWSGVITNKIHLVNSTT